MAPNQHGTVVEEDVTLVKQSKKFVVISAFLDLNFSDRFFFFLNSEITLTLIHMIRNQEKNLTN